MNGDYLGRDKRGLVIMSLVGNGLEIALPERSAESCRDFKLVCSLYPMEFCPEFDTDIFEIGAQGEDSQWRVARTWSGPTHFMTWSSIISSTEKVDSISIDGQLKLSFQSCAPVKKQSHRINASLGFEGILFEKLSLHARGLFRGD